MTKIYKVKSLPTSEWQETDIGRLVERSMTRPTEMVELNFLDRDHEYAEITEEELETHFEFVEDQD